MSGVEEQFIDESASLPELLDMEDSELLLKRESNKTCSKHSSEVGKTAIFKAKQETSAYRFLSYKEVTRC